MTKPADAPELPSSPEPRPASDTGARNRGIMVFSMTLSRVLGLLRDTVIAASFGLLAANDSYQIASRIPDTIFMLIAGGGLSSAFMPVFGELWHKDRREEAWKAFSVVVTFCSLVAMGLIVVAWILAPWIVHFMGAGQSEAIMPRAIEMSRIMLPAQFAFLVGSVLIATLYIRQRMLVPGLAPNVYNVGIIVGASLLPAAFGFGIEGVAWGALAGAFIGNLLLPAVAMARIGSHFRPSLDFRAPGVATFFRLLLPVILGFSLPSMVNLITQKFASGYGVGSNTALAYSNNLMQAPLGIFGQSLALAAFPVLTQFFAQGRMDLYRSEVSRTLRAVIYLGVASSVLMFVLAPQLVHIIYGYGRGNNPRQLAAIADCLRIYCVGIPAWCMQPVLMRGFFSLQKTLKPIAIGTAMTGVFILEAILLEGNALGFRALPWATDVAAIALALILFFTLEGDVGRLARRDILVTTLKSLGASVALGLVAWAGAWLFAQAHNRLAEILVFGLVAVLAAWAYYFASRTLKMPETATMDRAVARLRRK